MNWETRFAWWPTWVGHRLIWGRWYQALPLPMQPMEERRRLLPQCKTTP